MSAQALVVILICVAFAVFLYKNGRHRKPSAPTAAPAATSQGSAATATAAAVISEDPPGKPCRTEHVVVEQLTDRNSKVRTFRRAAVEEYQLPDGRLQVYWAPYDSQGNQIGGAILIDLPFADAVGVVRANLS